MVTIPLTINSQDRILVIAPHPDDESIGVGGLIALYPKQTEVLVLTDGRYGNDKYAPSEMKEVRKQEFVNAMDIAGIKDYSFLDVEDGTLIDNKDIFVKIDIKNYTHIFLPNPNDNHSDHTASYEYIMDCISVNTGLLPNVYQYEVHKPLADVEYHLDITDVIEKKIDMVNSHRSQVEIHKYGEQIRLLAMYRGFQNEHTACCLEVYHKVNVGAKEKKNLGIEIEASKYKQFTKILTKWLHAETKSTILGAYLERNKLRNIGIYGYGILGRALYDCLRNAECHIDYFVDKNKVADVEIPTYHDLSSLTAVDIIIVTTASGYDEIEKEIREKSNLECISISSILEEITYV